MFIVRHTHAVEEEHVIGRGGFSKFSTAWYSVLGIGFEAVACM